jgi:hypothetical protein
VPSRLKFLVIDLEITILQIALLYIYIHDTSISNRDIIPISTTEEDQTKEEPFEDIYNSHGETYISFDDLLSLGRGGYEPIVARV